MSEPVTSYITTRSLKTDTRILKVIAKRTYTHIPDEIKQKLIQTIEHQGCKIKKLAKDLNLNYATAKTILYSHKMKGFELQVPTKRKIAQVQDLTSSSKVQVIAQIDGVVVSSQHYILEKV